MATAEYDDYDNCVMNVAVDPEALGIRATWGAATHVGKVRSINEDAYLDLPGAFVVADGMGGHNAGDVASGLAIQAIRSEYLRGPLDVTAMQSLIDAANGLVWTQAQSLEHEGMGCTLVGAFLVRNGDGVSVVVANVGDSRCYLCADGVVRQLTRDHSHVQELVDAGVIGAEEALRHPERNVVTRAIGVGDHVRGDFFVVPPRPFVRLLLCSDGVSGELDFASIEQFLLRSAAPQTVAQDLVGLVLETPARDNATAVVIDLVWEARVLNEMIYGDADDATGPRPRPNDRSNSASLIDEVPVVEDHTSCEVEALAETDIINDVPT